MVEPCKHMKLYICLTCDENSVSMIVTIFVSLSPLSKTGVSIDAFILKVLSISRQPDCTSPCLTRRAPAADFACVAPPGSSRDSDPTLAVWVRSFD